MTIFGIVDTVTNLPPARDMLHQTALRVNMGGGKFESYLFINDVRAATVRPGDWVAFDGDDRENRCDKHGSKLHYMRVVPIPSLGEYHSDDPATRLAALRAHCERNNPYRRRTVTDEDLQAMDKVLAATRVAFNCAELPARILVEGLKEWAGDDLMAAAGLR